MKKTFTLITAFLGLAGLHAQNDCANALPITPGTYSASYPIISQVPQPMCITGANTATKGVWYSYTPTANYTAIVSSNVSGFPAVDTRLHIYKGTCDNLTCVTGDDDSGGAGYSSLASFAAVAGTTYYIAFDNKWTPQPFHFKLIETPYVAPLDPGITFSSQTVGITGTYILGAVDINGDYRDDIICPTSNSVKVLYQAPNNSGFTPATLTTPFTNFLPDWSLAAGDWNKDGYNDLLYGDGNRAVIMVSNSTGTAFSDVFQTPTTIFSQRTNFVDINNDGHLDAFVCHDVKPNIYFLNNGSGGFTYHQGGLGDHPSGGNYGSIWVDYDNDGDSDLFIAKCRGANDPASLNELHRNNGNGTFTNVSVAANMSDMLQTWSTAFGDFDNDGDMDAMVGANSTSSGSHKLMKNNGDGTFSDATSGTGFDTFTYYGREHVAHDFNNDGFIDVMGGGNRIMFNNGDMTFSPVPIPAASGPVADLNNDGFLDILNENTVYFNSANTNGWIKLHLKGVTSNGNGIGARVEIYGDWGKQIRDVRSGDGFAYMSSLNTHFGIGDATEIDQVVVKWPSGVIDVINNPQINQPLLVVEGSTLGKEDFNSNAFMVYPNPAKDFLEISGDNRADITKASIYDISGKLVRTTAVINATVPVQALAKGSYIILLQDNHGKQYSRKFIKG